MDIRMKVRWRMFLIALLLQRKVQLWSWINLTSATDYRAMSDRSPFLILGTKGWEVTTGIGYIVSPILFLQLWCQIYIAWSGWCTLGRKLYIRMSTKECFFLKPAQLHLRPFTTHRHASLPWDYSFCLLAFWSNEGKKGLWTSAEPALSVNRYSSILFAANRQAKRAHLNFGIMESEEI